MWRLRCADALNRAPIQYARIGASRANQRVRECADSLFNPRKAIPFAPMPTVAHELADVEFAIGSHLAQKSEETTLPGLSAQRLGVARHGLERLIRRVAVRLGGRDWNAAGLCLA